MIFSHFEPVQTLYVNAFRKGLCLLVSSELGK